MVSPWEAQLGPIIADIFMRHMETHILRSTTIFYARYMDDTFIVTHNREQAVKVFIELSKCHPNIEFTTEGEMDGSFQFLDVSLKKRQNGSLQRSVFHKSAWTR